MYREPINHRLRSSRVQTKSEIIDVSAQPITSQGFSKRALSGGYTTGTPPDYEDVITVAWEIWLGH
jgi:hypothetical protein